MVIVEVEQELARLDDRCYDIMKKAYRDGTCKNKRCHGTSYSKFCQDLKLPEYPADEWQLARYAIHTSEQVTSIGTVRNYVGGVRSLHKIAGFPVPPVTSPNLKMVLDGLKHEMSRPVKQAAPLNREILMDISKKVVWSSAYNVCCFSATLVGFYLGLHSSNLVPVSTKKFSPQEQLTRGDVALDDDMEICMIDIQWSKTIRYQERQLWLTMSPASVP